MIIYIITFLQHNENCVKFNLNISGHLEFPVLNREALKRRHQDQEPDRSREIYDMMAENGSGEVGEIPVPPPLPPPPPPPLPIKGMSKGLNMWKKKQAELTEPGDQTADVIDQDDQPTGAPGTSYDPKGRNTSAPCDDLFGDL